MAIEQADGSRLDGFVAPEGPYSKVFDLHIPLPPVAPSGSSNAPSAGPAPTNTSSNADPQAPPPPLPAHPSQLVSITVRYACPQPSTGHGGFLGGGKRQREQSALALDSPASPTLGQTMQALPSLGPDASPHYDSSSVHSSEDPTNNGSTSSGPPALPLPASPAVGHSSPIVIPGSTGLPAQPSAAAPLPKRRTTLGLSSLSSLGASMGSGGASQPASRPKAAFKGTNSTFIKSSEGLPLAPQVLRSLASPDVGSPTDTKEVDRTFAVHTTGKMVVFSEMSPNRTAPFPTSSSSAVGAGVGGSLSSLSASTSTGSSRDVLAKIVLSAIPTCVTVNPSTASPSLLDVLVGFSTGDILYFDPFCSRYTRFNKSGNVTDNSAVTSLLWIPGGGEREGLFMSAHADGSCVVWDKEREDPQTFTPHPWPPLPLSVEDDDDDDDDEAAGGTAALNRALRTKLLGKSSTNRVSKVRRDERADDVVVTLNPNLSDKKTKLNPITHWRVSRKPIKDVAFSPDLQHCAIVSEDGCLRIIDAGSERLLDTYVGYFGALSCVAWSTDGRFVFTGGQDDLVTVYSPLEQRVVARCQGHCSFVTGIAFDPWQSDDRTSRFASVSEDCKVIFWDLSSAALSRPRAAPTHIRRQSIGSTLSLSLSRRRTLESQTNLPSLGLDRDAMFHPAPGRNEVAILQPVIVRQISTDPLSSVQYHRNGLVTVSRSGQVKLFSRPAPASDRTLSRSLQNGSILNVSSPPSGPNPNQKRYSQAKRRKQRESVIRARRRRGTSSSVDGEGAEDDGLSTSLREAEGLLGGSAVDRYADLRPTTSLQSVEA